MSYTKLPCLCCGKKLDPIEATDEEGFHCQPNDGIVFWTTGNYGSTFFDSLSREHQLVICICDECLVKNEDKLTYVRLAKHKKEVWKELPKKRYTND